MVFNKRLDVISSMSLLSLGATSLHYYSHNPAERPTHPLNI